MTHREVVAVDTILRNNPRGPLDELPARRTGCEHLGQTVSLVDVAEEIFGITGNPTITLRHKTTRVDRDEFISAVCLPDAGQPSTAVGKGLHQLIDWTNRDAAIVTAFEPDFG